MIILPFCLSNSPPKSLNPGNSEKKGSSSSDTPQGMRRGTVESTDTPQGLRRGTDTPQGMRRGIVGSTDTPQGLRRGTDTPQGMKRGTDTPQGMKRGTDTPQGGMRQGTVESILPPAATFPPLVKTHKLTQPPTIGGSLLQPQRGYVRTASTERNIPGASAAMSVAEEEATSTDSVDEYDVMLKFLEEMEEEEDNLPERSNELTTDGGGRYNFNRYSRPPLADLPAAAAAIFSGLNLPRRRNDQQPLSIGGPNFPYPYLVPPPEPLHPNHIQNQRHEEQKFGPGLGGGGNAPPVLDRRQQQRPPTTSVATPSWNQPPAFRAIDVDREAGYDTHLPHHHQLLHPIPDKMDDMTNIDGYVDALTTSREQRIVSRTSNPELSERRSIAAKPAGDAGVGSKAVLTLAQLSTHLSAPPPRATETATLGAAAPVREVGVTVVYS